MDVQTQPQEEMVEDRLIKLYEIERMTGISRSTLYRLKAEGDFPDKIMTGKRQYAFWLSDVVTWLKNRQPATRLVPKSAVEIHEN